MKARTLLAAAAILLLSHGLGAQNRPLLPDPPGTRFRPDTIVFLYPEGQDSPCGVAGGPVESNGVRRQETLNDQGHLRFVGDFARFELYLPDRPNGQMVVILPGGAYWITCIYSEGLHAAKWFTDRGITAAVLEYRMPEGHPVVPLADVQNTFRWCRENAERLGVDQIGIMGFSAGGHLAATASNFFTDALTRPDFSILFYPVISMKEGITHTGTFNNLFKNWKMVRPEIWKKYSMEEQVTADTPPSYIVLCGDDDVVTPDNSILYYNALRAHGVEAEMHIFPTGGHGFGFTDGDNAENDIFRYARPSLETSLQAWMEKVHHAEKRK